MRSLAVVLAALLPATLASARGLPKDLNQSELVKYLAEGGVDARIEACKRLGDRGGPEALAAMGNAATRDPVVKVRATCMDALEELGSREAVPYVREALLNDQDKAVRIQALEALEKIDPRDGAATVVKVLEKDPEPEVRKRAHWVIEHRKWTNAQSWVIWSLRNDTSADVRRAALKSLMEIGSEEAFAAIYQVMLEDESVEMRREASEVVERRPRQSALPHLCKALGDKDRKVASNAAKAIGGVGLREGAGCLREAASRVSDDRLAETMNKVAAKLEK